MNWTMFLIALFNAGLVLFATRWAYRQGVADAKALRQRRARQVIIEAINMMQDDVSTSDADWTAWHDRAKVFLERN